MLLEQKSFINPKPTLYLVSTPIGNLDDITLRALKILKDVDFILTEDTRISQKLLLHYHIKKPLISFYEHNEKKRLQQILQLLNNQHNLALISDAGTPLISDPGFWLVKEVQKQGFYVIVVPGPTAFLTAFLTSGMPLPLMFIGFLPRSYSKKKDFLVNYRFYQSTLLMYETAYRLKATLELIFQIYGNRKVSLCRELTKKFEHIINDDLQALLRKDLILKGEYVIAIERYDVLKSYQNYSLSDHIQFYLKQGFTEKEVFSKISKERKISKKDIYHQFKVKQNK